MMTRDPKPSETVTDAGPIGIGLKTLFFRERRLAALAILIILSAGMSAFLTIGRQEDPTITNLFASIVTPYPGADPARVEALVTDKIETELKQIAEIDTIESVSRSGVSTVQIELSSFISQDEIEQAWSEIRDALSDAAIAFPAGVPDPDFDNDVTGAYTAISAILPRHDGVPLSILTRFAAELEDRMRDIGGTKVANSYGLPIEEVLVTIDPVQLASLGLTQAQISGAIRQADAKVSAGQLFSDRADLLVEVSGEIDSLSRLAAIPIATSENGLVTRLGDIATIDKTVRMPRASIAYVDGQPAILVAAKMEDDLQVDVWTGRLTAELAGFEATLPGGLEHRRIFDQSGYTADRLTEVATNMLIGVTLVLLVLLVTLGLRAALAVAIVLPLVSLASVATLGFIGISIHQMSVTGLIVALGLLVDAAIVMTDEIRKRLTRGMTRVAAVADSVDRLAAPLLASTVTTALAFLPMALLPGPAGDFVGAIAMAVIIMLCWSFVIAMTLTPALAGWLLPDPERARPGIFGTGVRIGPLARAFEASIRLSLNRPRLSILYALILPVIGFMSFPTLTAQFFPGVERDQFYVDVEMPAGTAIAETERTVMEIDVFLRDDPGITSVSWVIGESAPSFYYNMVAGREQAPDYARALITTRSPEATAALITPLQRSLDRLAPNARVLVRDLVQGPPVNAPVELRFVGPDLETLRDLGDEARRIVASVPTVTHIRTTVTGGAPKIDFILDEDKVRLAGLDLVTVAGQLEAALDGAIGGSLIEGTEELPVRVRVGQDNRSDAGFVETFDVLATSPTGRTGAYAGVPLSTLGEMRIVPAESAINRRNGERNNTVQAFIQYGVLPEETLADVRVALDREGFEVPQGYRLEIGGDADARSETITNLMASVGLIVTLTIATIVLTFNSFRLALVAGVVCILAAGLSILALAVFQYPFGIQAVIGVIGSIGVSINAAIIVMTALQADPLAAAGDRERMVEIVTGASRHIVSTTITTFGGFLPLILEGGGFWPPFAMSIAGGVLLSTVVSFYFTPPMFALVYRKRAAMDGESTPVPA
ncbi:MAG: efflux RND transporter permease subunit [Pseudomonadota bacterium]